jgi:hypothetical protein
MKFRVFRDILPCSQTDAKVEVDIDFATRQYIPEDRTSLILLTLLISKNKKLDTEADKRNSTLYSI